jgi:hypothetical protein
MPWFSSLRAASRRVRASARDTTGHLPKVSRFPAVRLPVGHAPEFCPIRHDFKVHAFTVAESVGLVPWLGVADSSVRQRCADFGHLGSMT